MWNSSEQQATTQRAYEDLFHSQWSQTGLSVCICGLEVRFKASLWVESVFHVMSISLILSLYSSTDSHVTLIHTIHHSLQICLSLKQSKKTGYRLMSGYLRQHSPSPSDLPKPGIKPPHSGGVISSGSLTLIITYYLLKPPASLIGLLTCSNKEPKSACM